jgi:hypothetical protein
MSHGSTVGTATVYRLGDRAVGVRIPEGSRDFTSLYRQDQRWGTPSLLSIEYLGFFNGVKHPRREADHSTPTSAEIKKTWIYTSTPSYVFMG